MKNLKIFAMIIVLIMTFTACRQTVSTYQEQYDLGVRFLNEENYEEAIIAFEAAIRIDPKNPEAYIGLADIYIKQGDEDKAREILEKGLENISDNQVIINMIDELEPKAEVMTTTTTTTSKPTKEYITIKGEQYSTSLTELNLNFMELNNYDIKELSEMTNLTHLELGWNNISDISSLAGLTNLTILKLNNNNISDISPLAGLTNLTVLRLDCNVNNGIDISPLAGLTNLTELGLSLDGIVDISPLAGLTNLTVLRLGNNNISDISPLTGLTNLTDLALNGNYYISDISPLAKLINLKYLLWTNREISRVDDEALEEILPNNCVIFFY